MRHSKSLVWKRQRSAGRKAGRTLNSSRSSGGSRARKRRSDAIAGWAFASPLIIVLAGFVLIPVLSAARLSFFDSSAFSANDEFIGLGNYAEILRDASFWRIVKNTLVWTSGSLVGQIGLGLGAALLVNQRLRIVRFVRPILIMPYVIPSIALALMCRWMLDARYGVVSFVLQTLGFLPADQSPLAIAGLAMPTVILANVWRGFPFAMLVYTAALQGVDVQQYEAAHVDGANAWQSFRHITLPNLKQATIALLVLRGIWTVTYFDLIWLITHGGPAGRTTHWPIWIFREAMGRFRFGFAASLAMLMAIVLLVLVVGYSRSRRGVDEFRGGP